ncbi:hypothetical protein OSB04_000619 [Centaurea solstitialis]|uniref:Uncharacterized protein n=1 Tax=Centaurea solstitialis TaxID=347529 RepID=A0AA38U8U0_9ASTR|nr:hypothetical protein OSB04_000619 [Centaurea solstitialis]
MSISNPPPPEPPTTTTTATTVIAIPTDDSTTTHHRRTTTTFFTLRNWQGAKPIPLAISISVGIIVSFAVPKPSQLSTKAWHLFAIFLTTIAGLILGPLPVGAWAFICLTASVITKTLSFAAAFAAFTNEVIWLIVASFFFSRGFVKTGLGDRMAMYFVRWLGKSTLGLAYGLAICEAVISPAMPSSTARAGGIFLPIINSLAIAGESRPKDGSARKLGLILFSHSFRSFLRDQAHARRPILAKTKLEQMGPVTSNEWIMMGTMLVTVALWISGESLNISSVVAAMLGLSILLILGVLTWDDCLSEKSAWDTLAWFGVLIGMATQLTVLGVVPWIATCVADILKSLSVGWHLALLLLQAVYFFIHYLFAGQTAHVGALYSAFLSMHLTAKVPGELAALALAYNTNLFGALTH